MAKQTIEFQPLGRQDTVRINETILDNARRLGLGLAGLCGGVGQCGSCRVQVLSGKTSPVTPTEREFFSDAEIKAGWRLACRTTALGSLKVHVPQESLTTTQSQASRWVFLRT